MTLKNYVTGLLTLCGVRNARLRPVEPMPDFEPVPVRNSNSNCSLDDGWRYKGVNAINVMNLDKIECQIQCLRQTLRCCVDRCSRKFPPRQFM